ncbi:hypothetical protein Pcinc_022504 [Petrolisthes cinctipes]|uniref:Protein HGH1 homolog n=1 Tax=Petrolisthes cinctipes TaxID=88211 RepID=A0AAE1FFB9_PETCI|nr:hypothetical protein Pcinc_022504 [Petrolisthes cinctipes]
MEEAVAELQQFLVPDARKDLKSAACMTTAQLTGTPEGLKLLSCRGDILCAVVRLVRDPETYTAKDAMRVLVNMSAEEEGATALLKLDGVEVVGKMVELVKDKEYAHADFACGVLANLSKRREHCQEVWKRVCDGPTKLEGLIHILCQIDYNKKGAKLHLLAPVITNFSQLPHGRRLMLDKESYVFQRLIPFMEYKESKGRRMSVIATVHNCCFDKEYHPWLLGDEVDLAPRLALPLAGPDTFTLEENESLPPDLQFLPDDKEREQDVEVRKLLLQALMQLCITRSGREVLRDQNLYLILREHHKWEEDRHCIMLNEDLVNLIVRTEQEIGEDDLSNVNVPEDLASKFVAEDEKYLAGGTEDLTTLQEEDTPDK